MPPSLPAHPGAAIDPGPPATLGGPGHAAEGHPQDASHSLPDPDGDAGCSSDARNAGRAGVLPYDHGDCFFANLLPQVEPDLGRLTIPQLRLWIADLYDAAAPDLARVLSQSDPCLPGPDELEQLMKRRAEILRRHRFEWGIGMDYMVLGLKLYRPAYTYKDKESELPGEVRTSLRNDRARGRPP